MVISGQLMLNEFIMTKESIKIGALYSIKENGMELYEIDPAKSKPYELNDFSEIAWADPFP
jgi:hypothetical protein